MIFSPSLHARNALLATLNKVLKSFIRLSPTAVQTFLLIAQKQGVEPRPLRFALDTSGAVVLRAACDSDPEDAAWSFTNLPTSSFTREIGAILTCWVIHTSRVPFVFGAEHTFGISALFFQFCGGNRLRILFRFGKVDGDRKSVGRERVC